MGLFDSFKGNNSAKANNATSLLNLSKEDSLIQLNLQKDEVHNFCSGIEALNGLVSRVGLCLDISGSMDPRYKKGIVQAVVEKIFPLALEFDDNGSMEMWAFSDGFYRLPDITIDNYYGYVNREIVGKYKMGGTRYKPVINDLANKYLVEEPANMPNYIVFITDGNCSDANDTTNVIKGISDKPIFIQFVGIGNENFAYLNKLDTMQGRYVDNANFFKVVDPKDIKYSDLLNEYPSWLNTPQVRQMLGR